MLRAAEVDTATLRLRPAISRILGRCDARVGLRTKDSRPSRSSFWPGLSSIIPADALRHPYARSVAGASDKSYHVRRRGTRDTQTAHPGRRAGRRDTPAAGPSVATLTTAAGPSSPVQQPDGSALVAQVAPCSSHFRPSVVHLPIT